MDKIMDKVKNMGRSQVIGAIIIVLLIAFGIKMMPIGIPFAIVGIVITGLLCFTGKDAT